MPARRLVVAAASGVILVSMLISTPADARTTTTQRRTTTTERERQRTTTTERERDGTTTTRKATTSTTRETPTSTTEVKATTATTGAERTSTTAEVTRERTSKRYLVVVKKGNRGRDVADEHKRTRGVKVQRVYGHALRGYEADIPDDELDAVKKDRRVAYVERPKAIKKFAQTLPVGVEKVSRVGENWSSTRPGDGGGSVNSHIYVIDTGIQAHPDLNGATEYNGRGGPASDCDGHGTHMSGIAGAVDNTTGVVGVAPGVRLHGVKVLDCNGIGTDLNAIAGLEWIIANGTKPAVITMSFGGPISRPFDDAILRALSAGYVIVTAAGNEHKNACKLSPAHMGELPGVITVGATTKKDRPAGFSNGGPCVDVWAPGVSILSYHLNGQLALATGTSASAPHVAGVAALYLSGNGGASPAAVESAIKSKAIRLGSARRPLLRVSAHDF